MSDQRITAFIKLKAQDESNLEKLLALLTKQAEKIKSHPDCLASAVCRLNEDQAGVMGPSTGENHPLCLTIITTWTSEPARLRYMEEPGTHEVHTQMGALCSSIEPKGYPTAISFTRPELAQCADPFIVVAKFGYQTGTIDQALVGWKELVEYGEKEEPETLGYSVFVDGDDLRTLEIYESKRFVYDVHVKSDAIKKNGVQNGKWRTGQNCADKYHVVAGWLAK